MYRANVRITLRPSILDPQGKAISHALHNLGFAAVREVRTGKVIELLLDAEDAAQAEELAHEAAARLLANPVMEDYSIEIEPVAAEAS